MILQIRGANGSGKSTVARAFMDTQLPVDLVHYNTIKGRPKVVEGYGGYLSDTKMLWPEIKVVVVGSYHTQCGGLDTVPTFDLAFQAVRKAATLAAHVVCEGILASTVSGSWLGFAREMTAEGHPFAFAYLQTPLEECIRRIRTRNGGKPFKERLVTDKVRAIAMTRQRMMAAGLPVYDLPLEAPEEAARCVLLGEGEEFRAH